MIYYIVSENMFLKINREPIFVNMQGVFDPIAFTIV